MKKLLILLAVSAFISCKQKNEKIAFLPADTKEDSALVIKAQIYFKKLPIRTEIATDPVKESRVKLGHLLFYDPRISKSGTTSCNSCHNLSNYGVDNLTAAQSQEGNPAGRNVPTVFNAALHNMYFWDGRALLLEEQPGKMVLNPDELSVPHLGFIVNRLRSDSIYPPLFAASFPDDKLPVSFTNLKKAIAAFERTLLSPSRFDVFMNGNLSELNEEEKAGLALFMDAGCANCHNGVGIGGTSTQRFGIFTDYRTVTHSRVDDEGKMNVSGNTKDKDVFKVPGLRNVGMTYPYFHDGSIANLDTTVKIMGKVELNKQFTETEVKNIVSFLKTLTGEIRVEVKKIPPELKLLK
jgi:cytochrome c peroxidase